MELPIELQSIIHEYARPVTRPDWRTLHKLSIEQYFILVRDSYKLHQSIVLHNLIRKIKKVLFKDSYDF